MWRVIDSTSSPTGALCGEAGFSAAPASVPRKIYDSEHSKPVLKELFAQDPNRFQKFSREFVSPDDPSVTFLLDFSKNPITEPIFNTLLDLHINTSEGRAVLHVALRNFNEFKISEAGVDEVGNVLAYMKEITEARDLVAHFVSNVDGTHLAETLRLCDPETTLFVIASKTFTTQKTITNATSARDWFLTFAKDKAHVAKHFVALSTNMKAITSWRTLFPLVRDRPFDCPRHQLDNFEQLLRGAHGMDKHFKIAPLEQNLLVLATIGIWSYDFYSAQTHFADYFQQDDMESNGKSVTKDDRRINYHTGGADHLRCGGHQRPALVPPTLHQGTKLVLPDFLAPAASHNPIAYSLHHRILLSNFFAQPEALAFGKTEEVRKSKVFEGNCPSNSITFPVLTPAALGALIVLYEHEIFTQDEIGVEFGKVLVKNTLVQLNKPEDIVNHDSSTTGLIHYYLKHRKE
ncbi:SIS domain-containing protein [Obba rivulosa]|uniref:Glucose-6-phosphate isomerase n=1 Tax=Obba rivulosa TaxID=1052685 RepID=A0A8E2DJD6_9APHY|nr:SIS domain-containing protein [Obba rivulosa]